MLWSKKEDTKKLPDLPSLPKNFGVRGGQEDIGFDDVDVEEVEDVKGHHSLPTFPDSARRNGFSQAAIKDAVGIADKEGIVPLPEFRDIEEGGDKMRRVVEMEEWTPRERGDELAVLKKSSDFIPQEAPQVSDIFVKLDRFRAARRSLADAYKKLEEIDGLIKRIRETKLREEQELAGWEKEIAQIKARVEDVSENIFEKVA